MNLANRLTPNSVAPPQATHRLLPAQPANLPPGRVFAGIDIGLVEFYGPQPQPGDLVVILKDGANTFCKSEQAVKGLTAPTFNSSCLCQCPANVGLAFYMQSAARNSVVMAIDAATGALVQLFGLGDLWLGRGIAVDNATPYNLYVLDDRRILDKNVTVANPTPTRGYFTVVTFAIVAGQYGATAYADMSDPFPTPASVSDFPPIGNESQDQDAPNFTHQGLSVIGGTLHLTMHNPPARYLTMGGGVFTTHNLTLGAVPLNLGLRGQIVTVPNQPANKSNRYAIATDGASCSLLQFTASGVVTKQTALDASPAPAQLAAICNRLLLLSTNTATLLPSTENSP